MLSKVTSSLLLLSLTFFFLTSRLFITLLASVRSADRPPNPVLVQDDVSWEVCQVGLGESISHVLLVKPVVMGSFKCPGSIIVRWRRASRQEEHGGANVSVAASADSETAAQEIRLSPVCTLSLSLYLFFFG